MLNARLIRRAAGVAGLAGLAGLAGCAAEPSGDAGGGAGGHGGVTGDAQTDLGPTPAGDRGGAGGNTAPLDFGRGGTWDADGPSADSGAADAGSADAGPLGGDDSGRPANDASEPARDALPPPPDGEAPPDRGVIIPCTDDDLDGYSVGGCGPEDCDDQSTERYPTAPEVCDGLDNDCDFLTDEDFDLDTDVIHCGACFHGCLGQAVALICIEGECRPPPCAPGTHDLDGLPENGCEYLCLPVPDGIEACNESDDDCDGRIDEDFDLSADPDHCRACGAACEIANAVARCTEGVCGVGDCDFAWHDLDQEPGNGCEYACLPTRGGVEVCDDIDNDCDGQVDEDFDLETDPANCGGCARACVYPHGVAECRSALGGCALAACEDTYWDADAVAENGCEYRCLLTREGVEFCDLIDNDCDGAVDEDEPARGFTCRPVPP